MQELKIEKTNIKVSQVKFGIKEAEDSIMDYVDLLEVSLDIVPQGGFSPSEIRDRNRIQTAIDKDRKSKDKIIHFEDADWKNLKRIVNLSRWMIRHADLQKFLEIFIEKE